MTFSVLDLRSELFEIVFVDVDDEDTARVADGLGHREGMLPFATSDIGHPVAPFDRYCPK